MNILNILDSANPEADNQASAKEKLVEIKERYGKEDGTFDLEGMDDVDDFDDLEDSEDEPDSWF